MPTRYPVALFAYARPACLAHVLEPLRAAGVDRVYAYVDGVAASQDAEAQAAVVALLRAIDWANVTLTVRPQNLGLHAALRTGLDDFFAHEPAGVVIEEDIRLADGAYGWLCDALDRYQNLPRAGAISAWNHRRVVPEGVREPYWAGRWSCWGWAGWRRTWQLTQEPVDALLARMARDGADATASGEDLVACARFGHWDAHLGLALLAARQLTLYPPRSLADHTGIGEAATNQRHAAQWRAVAAAPLRAAWSWPAEVVEYPGSAARWRAAAVADQLGVSTAAASSLRRRVVVAWHRLTRARGTWRRAVALRLALRAWRKSGGRAFDDQLGGAISAIRVVWHDYLRRHRDAFFGRGLEVGDAATLATMGGAQMSSCEVVDRYDAPGVHFACDLQAAWALPDNAFDVFVHQFTLHVLADDRAALWHAVRTLREEGTLFVTFPCAAAAPFDGATYGAMRSFVWRFYTLAGVRALLDELGLDATHAELEPLGGAAATAAYLLGVPAEAMDRRALNAADPDAPLLIGARITKPVGWAPRWSPTP